MAAELLTNAAHANHQVLEAWSARLGAPPAPPRLRSVPTSSAPTAAPMAPVAPAAVTAVVAPVEPAAELVAASTFPTGPIKVIRRLSLETSPETLDHTLFRQRDTWPDVWDRFPIMAMTTQLEVLCEIGREYGGGREVIELRNVRNFTWMDLSDPLDLEVSIAPVGDDTLKVALGKYCRANVVLGDFPSPARYEAPPLKNPRMPQHTGEEMFTERLMFHGPEFQGITKMGPIGDDGIYGEFENLPAKGSLLDNVGKLIAYIAMDAHGWGEGPLPLGLERVEFFGPPLDDGVPVHCDVRLADLQDDVIKAHGTLVGPDGNVWCHLEGWMSHIFHLDDTMKAVYDHPEKKFQSYATEDGVLIFPERWPTGASRDLTARRFLRRHQRDMYDGLNILQQRWWVLKTVAANDAARQWLNLNEGAELYPPEVDVVDEGDGRYRVTVPSMGGRVLYVAVAGVEWLATSLVSESPTVAIESRLVKDGDDVAALTAEVVAEVERRCPGTKVATKVLDVSGYTATAVPDLVVAWTVLD